MKIWIVQGDGPPMEATVDHLRQAESRGFVRIDWNEYPVVDIQRTTQGTQIEIEHIKL